MKTNKNKRKSHLINQQNIHTSGKLYHAVMSSYISRQTVKSFQNNTTVSDLQKQKHFLRDCLQITGKFII